MNRSHRRIVAWLGILGIAFAQLAVTAHACMIHPSLRSSSAPALAMVQDGHCAGHPDSAPPLAPQANACEVQCSEGAPSVAAVDLPPVALAPLPFTAVPFEVTVDVRAWDLTVLAASSARPPPSLQYFRLLN
jgi:hypothetical protein